jgi:hypothetical protein
MYVQHWICSDAELTSDSRSPDQRQEVVEKLSASCSITTIPDAGHLVRLHISSAHHTRLTHVDTNDTSLAACTAPARADSTN